jgi:hypothetical protein
MEEYLTIEELAIYCDRHPTVVRRRARAAEQRDPSKFPVARRIQRGATSVRLFSPGQAEEAKMIFESLQTYRNSKSKKGRQK